MIYRLDASAEAIAKTFAASAGKDQWQAGHIAPENFAPVVVGGREFITGPKQAPSKPRLAPRLWGVPPPPKSDDPARRIYGVRNPSSPFWIGSLRNSELRCLVPATSFMEWGDGHTIDGRPQKHWYEVSDQDIFAFAGVWKDSEIPSFAILSCPANAELQGIGRGRMPVVLPAFGDAQNTWLFGDWKRASALLQPYSSSLLREVQEPALKKQDGPQKELE